MTFWQFAFKNVTRNSRAYFAYFVSSSFSIAVFFSFAVYLFHPKLQNFDMTSEISGLMIFSEVVIVFFSFFFLLYSIGTFLKVRKKQFGVLTILGISRKQLHRLVFMENMLIGILSIFFGMQFGVVFSQFFLLVTAKLTHVPGIYLYGPTNAFILTTIVFLRTCLKSMVYSVQKRMFPMIHDYTSNISREKFELIREDLENARKTTRPRTV
ncbi:ABC transporter permease, partial [Bacillus thuringiensis]|uniref:ABC transporter permease n=1 Tax=Bacillus thuringiensis TaxID=1428 RepID=UPI003338B6D4